MNATTSGFKMKMKRKSLGQIAVQEQMPIYTKVKKNNGAHVWMPTEISLNNNQKCKSFAFKPLGDGLKIIKKKQRYNSPELIKGKNQNMMHNSRIHRGNTYRSVSVIADFELPLAYNQVVLPENWYRETIIDYKGRQEIRGKVASNKSPLSQRSNELKNS